MKWNQEPYYLVKIRNKWILVKLSWNYTNFKTSLSFPHLSLHPYITSLNGFKCQNEDFMYLPTLVTINAAFVSIVDATRFFVEKNKVFCI